MRKFKKYIAFTLIELLFVIVIVGVMISLELSIVGRIAIEKKVEKTAFQIQQVLQAGLNYSGTYGKFPIFGEINFIENFIPINGNHSVLNGSDYGYTEYIDSNVQSKKFSVCLAGNDGIDIGIFKRIAGLIPNATWSDKFDRSCIDHGCYGGLVRSADKCVYATADDVNVHIVKTGKLRFDCEKDPNSPTECKFKGKNKNEIVFNNILFKCPKNMQYRFLKVSDPSFYTMDTFQIEQDNVKFSLAPVEKTIKHVSECDTVGCKVRVRACSASLFRKAADWGNKNNVSAGAGYVKEEYYRRCNFFKELEMTYVAYCCRYQNCGPVPVSQDINAKIIDSTNSCNDPVK